MSEAVGEKALPIGLQRRGPPRIVEDAWIGRQGHIRVDERRTAKSATDNNIEVWIETEVEERRVRPEVPLGGIYLDVAGRFEECFWVLARVPLQAALEHADRAPGACQPRRGNATAVAGADDHDVVMLLQIFE